MQRFANERLKDTLYCLSVRSSIWILEQKDPLEVYRREALLSWIFDSQHLNGLRASSTASFLNLAITDEDFT